MMDMDTDTDTGHGYVVVIEMLQFLSYPPYF